MINQLQSIWIFDIDGVITDPITKKIVHPEIVDIITGKLIKDQKVAFNTGRSSTWLDKMVIDPIRKLLEQESGNYMHLTNLISVCEMGNIIIEYDKNGQARKNILNKSTIPEVLRKTIRDFVKRIYSDSMFVDESKEVILTIEMIDGYSQKEYKKIQDEFREEITIIMANYHPHLHASPSSTNIAIDVKPILSGKDLGTNTIVNFYKSHDIELKNQTFLCFGDSISDVKMTDYLHTENINTELIFVGPLEEKFIRKYPIHLTKSHYSAGTLEYLKSISKVS